MNEYKKFTKVKIFEDNVINISELNKRIENWFKSFQNGIDIIDKKELLDNNSLVIIFYYNECKNEKLF